MLLEKMSNELSSRKMAEMPIGKLIFVMSVPAMISMLVQALYNVVDSLFVARYTNAALSALATPQAALEAVTIAFPMQTLIIAFSVGIGVGAGACISRLLGQKLNKQATEVAQHGILLALCGAVLFVIIGLTLPRYFMELYSSVPEIVDMGTSYLQVLMCCSVFVFIEQVCNKILQSTGNMRIPMITQLIGAVTNIVLDPLFIFGIWIFPEWGVLGAAVATVIGQGCAMLFCLSQFIFRKQEVRIGPKGFRFNLHHIGIILKIGLPTTIMNAIASLTTSVLNVIIKAYRNAITVLGIYFKLQSFVFMPTFGLMQGVLPILSYNYGYNSPQRFKKTFLTAVSIALIFETVGLILFMSLAPQLMTMFGSGGEMTALGAKCLRIISISFIFAAFGITLTTGYQSLNSGLGSLGISLTRQVLFLIPIAYLMEKAVGLVGVWYAYPMAEVLNLIIFIPLGIRLYKSRFAALKGATVATGATGATESDGAEDIARSEGEDKADDTDNAGEVGDVFFADTAKDADGGESGRKGDGTD